MSWIAYGTPGKAPDFCQSERFLDLGVGDVSFAIEALPTDRILISDDGTSLVPYVPDMKEAKAIRWQAALAYRNARQTGGCTVPLGRVDTDPDSQRKISGAVLAALIAKGAGAPFSIDWTMFDGLVVTHSADAMIALGMTVTMYLAACQYAGTAIKHEIEIAMDQATLDAIDITVGYPN